MATLTTLDSGLKVVTPEPLAGDGGQALTDNFQILDEHILASGSYHIPVAFKSVSTDFTETGIVDIFTVPTNYDFLPNTFEIISTSVTSPSGAPVISFGRSDDTEEFVPSGETTSNATYDRQIFNSPQNVVPSGDVVGQIHTASTASVHTGYLLVSGFMIPE